MYVERIEYFFWIDTRLLLLAPKPAKNITNFTGTAPPGPCLRPSGLASYEGTSRFLAHGGGGGGGHFEVKEGHPDFFTNNMIFLHV